MLHERLWQENADLVQACLAHPFVRRLANGSLEVAAFKRYVAQDAFFLHAFLRAYAVALARCAELAPARALHLLMAGVLDELKMHAAYADALSIDFRDVRPFPATTAYIDFLLATAWQHGAGQTIAAMTPCMRLYAHLGASLRPALRPAHPYANWIETYSSPDFADLAATIEGLLDTLAEDAPAAHDAYRYALQCELDFFSAPLEAPR
jgi:thiaminase/transcriptional activator TenA